MQLLPSEIYMRINTTQAKNSKLAYSIRELSQLIGICERKIHYEIRNGKLKTARIGRRVLVLSREVDRWLDDAQSQTAIESR